MIDETILGLGHLDETPDIRDYPISALYIAEDMAAAREFPASYSRSGMPPVLNQGSTPRCVAFSSAAMKGWQDRRDQLQFFDFDEGRFFVLIHGTSDGAHVRDAMEELLHAGYPEQGGSGASKHQIVAYYRTPTTYDGLRAAILDFGPVVITMAWYRSWFRPNAQGVIPPAQTLVGGHAVVAYGWDQRGLRCRNSWGTGWGREGDFWMPQSSLTHLTSAWKAVDEIVHPIPYRHDVKVTASDGKLNVREHPNTAAKLVTKILKGRTVKVLELEKYGGKYNVNGVARTDWLRTNRGWIARGWTRLVG
jgi:hypothetical protein